MADLVRHVRADHAPTVSLYVNDFNAPAPRAYEAVGLSAWRRHGDVLMRAAGRAGSSLQS